MPLVQITVSGTYKAPDGTLLTGKRIEITPLFVFGDAGVIVPPTVVKVTTHATTAAYSVQLYTTDVAGAYVRYNVKFHNGKQKRFDLTDDLASTSLDELINAFDPTQTASSSVDWLDHEARLDALEAGGGTETATTMGALINSAGAATPNNTDFVATAESGGLLKKITWTNVKAFLKTYFDTLYQAILVSGTNIKTINGSSVLGSGDLTVSGGGSVDTANSPGAGEFARFTDADTIEGRTAAELKADLDLEIGTDLQAFDADLAAIAALTATSDNFIQAKSSAWASRTVAQVKTDLGLTGTNSGDKTSIVGISGTLAEFNTAVSDANLASLAGSETLTNKTLDADNNTVTNIGSSEIKSEIITGLTAETAIAGDDLVIISDTSAAGALRKMTRTNFVSGLGGGGGEPSDGDKGDITVSSTGTVWTIDNDAVTYAKIQNVSATDKLLGRSTSGAGDVEEIACTAFARSILDDANEAAFKATVNLEIGTDVQAFSANLDEYAAVNPTAAGLALLDDADAAAQRTTLGLGTLATQSGTLSGASSGTNTGDQTSIVGITGTLAQFNTAISDGNIPVVDDTAYDATSWNGNNDAATKNALRDKFETISAGGISNVVEDTTPQLGGNLDANAFNIDFDDNTGIRDDSGNEQLIFQKTASAVNQVEITNAATGNAPAISAAGGDTNIDLTLSGKGTGRVIIGGGAAGVIGVLDADASHYLNISCDEDLSADRSLQFRTGDADILVEFGGSVFLNNSNTGDQTTVSGNAGTATALQNARTIGGVSFDGTANITVSTATGGFTVSGGNLALGTNSITMSGSIGVTGTRVTKIWATDGEFTNVPTVGGTSILSGVYVAGGTDVPVTDGGTGSSTAAGARTNLAVDWSKSISVEDPTSAEDISLFYTTVAITITELAAVVIGSSPSVTYTVRHHTDRSNAGNEVVTSGTTVTSTTTGSIVTSFNDATVPADSWVWLETTAESGTTDEFQLTITYTKD